MNKYNAIEQRKMFREQVEQLDLSEKIDLSVLTPQQRHIWQIMKDLKLNLLSISKVQRPRINCIKYDEEAVQ